MYVETYGIRSIEYQHGTIAQSEKDPAFIKELKAKLDENKVTMSQINLEFGTVQSISKGGGRASGGRRSCQAVDRHRGAVRLSARDDQPAAGPAHQGDEGRCRRGHEGDGRLRPAKNVKVSAETRGAGTPEYVQQIGGVKPWEFMIGVIKDAGAASNVDIGNVGAMNQQELHDCIKGWLPYSSGNMHIKSSPFWDVGQAVKFTESLGYKGLCSIEVARHEGVRIVYNTILANLA